VQKSTKTDSIKALTAEVNSLKRRVAKLETKQPAKSDKPNSWRTLALVVLAGLAGATLIVGNLLFWTGRTLIETDRYQEATRSVIQKPAVQKAIADQTSDAIFERVDVEQLLAESLPERIQFAAPALASKVVETTNDRLQQVTASQKFENIWVEVNTRTHDRFIEFVRDYKGDGTINISDIYTRLVQNLQGTQLAFLSNVQLPSNIGSVQVIEAKWLPQAHWVVTNIDALRIVTILAFLLLSVLIVYVSKRRHTVALRLGIFYAVLMFLTLVAVRVGREFAAQSVDPRWQQAATQTWQALLEPFVVQSVTLLVLGLVVAFIAWISGPGKQAKRVQLATNDLLNGKAHKALFGSKESTFTKWVAKYRSILQWLTVFVAFLSLLFVSVTIANIVWVAIVMLIVLAAIQVCSARR
jgi:hypothetical protein